VLYKGKRNGRWGWHEEKWKGVKNNKNKDYAKYDGETQNGEPDGYGTDIELTFMFEKYVGEFKDGLRNGKGTIIYSFLDGSRYSGIKFFGEFTRNAKNGFGIKTYPDGRKSESEWKFSKRWNGIDYDKDGNITGRCIKGILYDKDGNLVE
jgi:hypothetical protein